MSIIHRCAVLRGFSTIVVGALVLVLSVGCISGQARNPQQPWRPADEALVWPPPPAETRIEFSGTIASMSDMGVQETGLQKLARFLFGSHDRTARAFGQPFGLAVSDAGGLYVTDTEQQSVFHFSRATGKLQQWKRAGKTDFIAPVSVAAADKLIFIADTGLGKVLAMNHKGKLLFEIDEDVERPASVAILDDTLLVADAGKHRLSAFSLTGEPLWKMGKRGSDAGQFNYPTHVTVDSEKRIYVTDSMNFRVQIFDSNRKFLKVIGTAGDGSGQLSRPKGVATDVDGNIYVVDALFDNIQIFDPQGRFLMHWGEAGAGPGQFWLPAGIAYDKTGHIFVADPYNHRIQIFKYLGAQ